MMNSYKKPEIIPNDMGGAGDNIDNRLLNVIDILNDLPLQNINKFLDVGIGKGQLAKWLARRGKTVTGIGLELESYGLDIALLNHDFGIMTIECSVEKMPFPDGSFDCVVMSHVLEHCPNVGVALQEVRRVLSNSGYLFITVPPHDDIVGAGHISVGWSIGQLMYLLVLNGFDIKNGKFIQYGYNIAAFVKKSNNNLPVLRCDRGDIHILNENDLFPVPIHTSDNCNDNFYGKIRAINWDEKSPLIAIRHISSTRDIEKILRAVLRRLPARVRKLLGYIFISLGKLVSDENDVVNPKVLKGWSP